MTGISARKLRWWDQQGLVKPGIIPRRQRWQTRRYTLQDIVCLLVVKALREKGLSLQKIRKSVDRIKEIGVEFPLAQLRMACLAHSVIMKKGDKYIDPLSGQMVIAEALEIIRPHLGNRRLAPAERAVQRTNQQYEAIVANL